MFEYAVFYLIGYLAPFVFVFAAGRRLLPILDMTLRQVGILFIGSVVGSCVAVFSSSVPGDIGFVAGYLAGTADILIRILPRQAEQQ